MRTSVVVTTYEQPDWLGLVLEGYRCQEADDFEVVVADDGSGPGTARVVDGAARTGELDVVHVWHEDRGFRKTEILDRAIRAATGDHLIFTDGDCVPRKDFVATHRRLITRDRFLSGGYVRLTPRASEAVQPEDVASGRAFDPRWLADHGQTFGTLARHRLRLLDPGPLATFLDAVTPTSPTFNGMNSSVSREAAVRVNGFDLDLTYGGLDREFGQRLENAGLRGMQVRHRAVVLHLHHERPYRDEATVARQRRHREALRSRGDVRAVRGIEELDALDREESPEVRVRRPGEQAGRSTRSLRHPEGP